MPAQRKRSSEDAGIVDSNVEPLNKKLKTSPPRKSPKVSTLLSTKSKRKSPSKSKSPRKTKSPTKKSLSPSKKRKSLSPSKKSKSTTNIKQLKKQGIKKFLQRAKEFKPLNSKDDQKNKKSIKFFVDL